MVRPIQTGRRSGGGVKKIRLDSGTRQGLNLSFYSHDEAVAASFAPGDTAGRYLPYESVDLYGDLQRRLRAKPAVII